MGGAVEQRDHVGPVGAWLRVHKEAVAIGLALLSAAVAVAGMDGTETWRFVAATCLFLALALGAAEVVAVRGDAARSWPRRSAVVAVALLLVSASLAGARAVPGPTDVAGADQPSSTGDDVADGAAGTDGDGDEGVVPTQQTTDEDEPRADLRVDKVEVLAGDGLTRRVVITYRNVGDGIANVTDVVVRALSFDPNEVAGKAQTPSASYDAALPAEPGDETVTSVSQVVDPNGPGASDQFELVYALGGGGGGVSFIDGVFTLELRYNGGELAPFDGTFAIEGAVAHVGAPGSGMTDPGAKVLCPACDLVEFPLDVLELPRLPQLDPSPSPGPTRADG